ncbi:2Fe-2S iron-sulfur cluster-binding protein [Riemerella columbina]|uniref:2Fe-2S iron-sulfur cluster-binding protein n=1 Tax=Riemerella columbina TaxID=103810 RepID=UPI00267044F0|nr:2Fe-2S iron-sulfur cluster-binding protein [Riemerella columbina]WKS94395.1 2Fe-2S iron-sulfur cluster-binding protein [Riemerella columbina]
MSEINKSIEPDFKGLKIIKKRQLSKNVFLLGLQPPEGVVHPFQSGQYLRLQHRGVQRDYSLVSAPYEGTWDIALKINHEASFAADINRNYQVGDEILSTMPMGRFVLADKPNEKRTILGFAGGIGITPIISHLKHILYTESGTRFFLFYANKTKADAVFVEDLTALKAQYGERLEVYQFYSQEETHPFFFGRINEKKIELIINQLLHLDEDDEESTIWDAVDEILICGPGAMIKDIATACYNNGMRKKNIHFELFASFNESIFPEDQHYPLVENIRVQWQLNKEKSPVVRLKNNKAKLLQQLLDLGYALPYSCKSGICGACRCILEKGEVEMSDNEYLTDKEIQQGEILTCVSTVLSDDIQLNFDLV